MSKGRQLLPAGWNVYITSSYPGGWIVPNKCVCTRTDGAQYMYTTVGQKARFISHFRSKSGRGIDEVESTMLERYCRQEIGDRQ